MLDDTRLRIFLSAAETGNFTKTAKAFKITQPAVSQNISDLEDTYEVRLFDRTRGAAVLTPQGKVFRNYAEGITASYDELRTVFTSFRELSQVSEVRLAVDAASLPWATAVVVPYIYKVCPDATVSIRMAGDADLRIESKGGIRSLEPSASFKDSALCRLICNLTTF